MTLIVKKHEDISRWLFVTPRIENRLPSHGADKGFWLRLDLIERVSAEQGIAVGDDTENYEYMLCVYTENGCYHPNPELHKSKEANALIDELLDHVSNAKW